MELSTPVFLSISTSKSSLRFETDRIYKMRILFDIFMTQKNDEDVLQAIDRSLFELISVKADDEFIAAMTGIRAQYPALQSAGLPSSSIDEDDYYLNFNVRADECAQAYIWAKAFYVRGKTFNARSTYGFKHDCERSRGIYTSNGEMIAAMLLGGFEGKQISKSMNWKFKIDSKSQVQLSNLVRSLGWASPVYPNLKFIRAAGLDKIGRGDARKQRLD